MNTNIAKAFLNLSKLSDFRLGNLYRGNNRMNNMGTALEYFIKDIFCGSLSVDGISKKDKIHSEFLSYSGNQNNPPDFILKGSDAVEVKKIGGSTGYIALNSSYPKSKLHNDDPRILASCRNCDGGNWNSKDIMYVVGSIVKGKIKLLWFVYGDCYAADREVYIKTFNSISKKVNETEGMEFTKTKELAGVKKVDPLGITYLRIRGMWGISTPQSVFGNLADYKRNSDFSAYALMLDSKFQSMPEKDLKSLRGCLGNGLSIKGVEIKSPNNPAQYLGAKLISIVK